MREIILEERRQRLERFITKVKTKVPPPHLRWRWADELIILYVGYLRAKNVTWPESFVPTSEKFSGSTAPALQMYVHDPVRNRAKDAIKILDSEDRLGLRRFLERLASAEEGELIGSEIQTIYARRKHKHGPYEELLDQIYKSNPLIGHKELYRILMGQVGKGVIKYIDSQHGLIVLEDGREFAVSGLKDQIYNRRREM